MSNKEASLKTGINGAEYADIEELVFPKQERVDEYEGDEEEVEDELVVDPKIEAIRAKTKITIIPMGEFFKTPEIVAPSSIPFSIPIIVSSIASCGVPKDSIIVTVFSTVSSFITSGNVGSITL